MIQLNGVTKEYRRGWYRRGSPVRALDGVTLGVQRGEAVGVVGLNGAGKSTLLRVLLGYVRPSAGDATIDGLTPRDYTEQSGIAYVPERLTIPQYWTVASALRAYAMLGNVGPDASKRVDGAMSRLGLSRLADRRVSALSKGNLQRLGIAQAILGDRKLMVLDEPTDGLDPVWTAELRGVLAAWRQSDGNRVLIIASHNLAEVERLADHAVLLHNGKLQGELPVSGAPGQLEESFLARVGELEEARS